MVPAQTVSVKNILGLKLSADGQSAAIGLASESSEYHLSFSTDLLAVLALTALKAKTDLEEKAPELKQPNKIHAFPCDKWEIRKSADGGLLLFGFRHVSGAWIRLQVSPEIAAPMRETLEVIEGRMSPPSARGSRN